VIARGRAYNIAEGGERPAVDLPEQPNQAIFPELDRFVLRLGHPIAECGHDIARLPCDARFVEG
jgi:hypothetical protein